jgi:hypothetical protein
MIPPVTVRARPLRVHDDDLDSALEQSYHATVAATLQQGKDAILKMYHNRQTQQFDAHWDTFKASLVGDKAFRPPDTVAVPQARNPVAAAAAAAAAAGGGALVVAAGGAGAAVAALNAPAQRMEVVQRAAAMAGSPLGKRREALADVVANVNRYRYLNAGQGRGAGLAGLDVVGAIASRLQDKPDDPSVQSIWDLLEDTLGRQDPPPPEHAYQVGHSHRSSFLLAIFLHVFGMYACALCAV